jgi:hypothetical protein
MTNEDLRLSAGVNENDVVVSSPPTLFYVAEQPGHSFGRVHVVDDPRTVVRGPFTSRT